MSDIRIEVSEFQPLPRGRNAGDEIVGTEEDDDECDGSERVDSLINCAVSASI